MLSGESPDRDMIANIQAQILEMKKEILDGNLSSVLTRFADLILVGLVAVMIGLMIVPLPTFLLDIFLTINITVAVTILMVSIYISTATQIASYPTLLLITTLYRLSLDISATRLILLKADAGEVIRSFGMFVVQRQLRGRRGDLPDHHPGAVHRHHQGRRARGRSGRPVHPRRHAGQADEHRRRPARRHHRLPAKPARGAKACPANASSTARWTAP